MVYHRRGVMNLEGQHCDNVINPTNTYSKNTLSPRGTIWTCMHGPRVQEEYIIVTANKYRRKFFFSLSV